jgi:hypothetical protein
MEPVRVLTWSQMEQIDEAAQSILERTGIKIDSPDALGLLERFGCRVDPHSSVVKMPRALTRQVVTKMRQDYLRPDRPERMPVRFSHVRFRPTAYQVHSDFTVSTGGFCCFLHDLDGCRRPAGRDDVLSAINLVNHLDQIGRGPKPSDNRKSMIRPRRRASSRRIGGASRPSPYCVTTRSAKSIGLCNEPHDSAGYSRARARSVTVLPHPGHPRVARR